MIQMLWMQIRGFGVKLPAEVSLPWRPGSDLDFRIPKSRLLVKVERSYQRHWSKVSFPRSCTSWIGLTHCALGVEVADLSAGL